MLNMITFLKRILKSASAIFQRSEQENTISPLGHSLFDGQTPDTNEADEVPLCPYCGEIQDIWPTRSKKKCSYCSRTMYVKYKSIERERGTGNLILSDKTLATGEDAWVYDWMIDLFDLGYSKKKFDKRKSEYAKKHGVTLNYRDTVWSILNEFVENLR